MSGTGRARWDRERAGPPGVDRVMDGCAGIPDRWLALSVPAPPRGEEHLLVEALLRLGSRSVERAGEGYVAYLPPPEEVESLLREAQGVIRAGTSLTEPALSWRWAPRGEGPDSARQGADPHPTTRACLALLGDFVAEGERVADVGAGTGVLALAAASLGAGEVLALERDPLAAALARERVAEGGLRERVRVQALRVGSDDLLRLGPFHGVVANIEAGTLLALLPAFGAQSGSLPREKDHPMDGCLHPGGWLVLSGAHRGEGRVLRERAEARGLTAVTERVEEGWWAGGFRAR